MKKTITGFFAFCMALMLAATFLAQPARASGDEVEPYEGTPLFVVAMLDANDELSTLLNAFLVHDPETGGTYLLGSSVIYDLVQKDYTACILGDDEFFNVAIPLAKENGVSYLYTTGLETAPYLVLSEGSGTKAAAMYREMTSDGITDPIQKNYDLSSGWEENSNGFLTYTGHKVETTCIIGAPMVSTEDSSVLGSITMNSDSEMTLAPLKPGQLSTTYCLETLNGGSPSGSSGSGSSSDSGSSDSGSSGSSSSDSGSSGSGSSGSSGSGLIWVAVIAVVGVLGYLIYRANTKKKNAGPKEGTVPLDLSDSAPLPVEHIGDTRPVQEAYGQTLADYGPTAPVSQWQLRCVSGTLNGQTIPLGGTLRIGRSQQCDISFPENTPGISGTHCEVSLEGDRVVLRDLNSTYGTYLGANNRLEAHRGYDLHMGDTFTLAQSGQSFRLEKLGVSMEEYGPAVRDLAGRVYRADAGGRITFGRGSGNQVRISNDEQSVSGSHCVLYREAGKLYLMDLGSTNGTFFSEQERLKPNTPYRIRRGMAFFLSNSRNTFVVIEE
ncbi:MAG: FHA domain-containing protein [Faecousia sp.]